MPAHIFRVAAARVAASASRVSCHATDAATAPVGERPALVQGRDHLRAARPRVPRQRTATASATSAGLTAEARLPAGPRRHGALAAAVLSRRRCGRRLRHRRLHRRPSRSTARCATSSALLREAHRRGLRVITELVLQPHLRPASVVPARARAPKPGSAERDFYVWSDTPGEIQGRADHLQGLRDLELGLGPGRERVLLASLLLAPARPELRQPGGARGAVQGRSTSGSRWASTACGWTPCPYLYEREGTNCENLPETHAFLKKLRAHIDAQLRGPHAAGRGEPVAGGRRRLLRRRRRMPHGVPLPADAAAVHGDAAWRTASRSSTSSQQTPAIPDDVPVGDVPAQPRRADAGDGDRRRARLHVPRLRARPAGAHQPRHPPPPGAAARQRPPPHRADERAAVLAARHAGHLLRRRDRHGRQHLPRRPQRRAHADAVERRPQRRLLARPTRSSCTCP